MVSKSCRILIATQNRGKLPEIQAELDGLNVQLLCLADLKSMPEAQETGLTFTENADLKALHYNRLSGLWTLADDSGLEVDALNAQPGVFSARYAGPDCDDARNNAKLLTELAGVPQEKRTARFRCAMSLAANGKIIARSQGTIEGQITFTEHGQNGFGYDPLFYVPDKACTTAQMPPAQKNAISHRGQATRAMKAILIKEKLL